MERDFRKYGPWLVLSIAAHGVWLGYQPSQASAITGPTVEPVALRLSGFVSAPAAIAIVDPVMADPPDPQVRRESKPEQVVKESASAPRTQATAAATPRPATVAQQAPPAEPPRTQDALTQSAVPEVTAPAREPAPISEAPQTIVTSSPRYAEPPAVPVYPPLARRRGWQGEVLLAIDVAATGVAGEPVVLRSSGFDLLDRAALEVARQWRIVPERRNGVAMPTRVEVPVQFALR